ncbi:methionine adenosyltransferase [Streptomyces sp. NPDC001890]|uniref:methionine adenosyltransferase n=1 Tax=Streptomyces sp. NPDC001890 TaxID=3364620 RepID=UPI00367691CA
MNFSPLRDFVRIQSDNTPHVEDLPYELVERKGLGHPDTMCDAIAERASRYYCLYCLEHFDRVAHHWFDKVMIFGGEADFDYGRGELTSPYTVLFAGKAALRCGSEEIPLTDILRRAAEDVLTEVTTGFVPERHLRVENRVVDHQGPGRGVSRYRPRDRNDMVALGDSGLTSNDCNLLHGFAPLSRLERAVLDIEQWITGDEFKATNPDTGWDVKVFGSRREDRFTLIVNMPFIAADIKSFEHYRQRAAECHQAMVDRLETFLGVTPDVLLNAADRGVRPYLTALGSVADTGDVGAVGRGNRVNGLITPMRAMSIEAPAGKNPLDHTGKLYNVMAHRLATEVSELAGQPVELHIFTSKEAPLNQPEEVVVRIHGWDGDAHTEARVRDLVTGALESTDDLTRSLIRSGVTMW